MLLLSLLCAVLFLAAFHIAESEALKTALLTILCIAQLGAVIFLAAFHVAQYGL